MKELLADSLPELLVAVLTILASIAFSLVGVAMEVLAANQFLTGRTGLGVWELAVGAVLLYAGVYLLGYQQARVRLRAVLDGDSAA